MNLLEQQNKQQKKALVDGELIEIYHQFVRVINQKESCNANQDPFARVGEKFRNTK
jgi:hypothetical protein